MKERKGCGFMLGVSCSKRRHLGLVMLPLQFRFKTIDPEKTSHTMPVVGAGNDMMEVLMLSLK